MVAPRARDPWKAGLTLVGLLWAIARPCPAPPEATCGAPRELEAESGWSVRVGCDPDTPVCPLRGAAPVLFGQALDLNRADARALEVLPGIGPTRAAQIVRARQVREFASPAELVRVRGIGVGTARGLAGWAEARPPGASGRPPESQKSLQLLSNPCENSYKRRAGRAASGR